MRQRVRQYADASAYEIRNPRRNEDRLGCPDRDGRRRGAARRRVPAGRRRKISGDHELRALRQGPVDAGGLQEPVAADREGRAGRARRLQQQAPELGAVRPGEVGAGRLHLPARGFARRRPLAGLSGNLVAARSQGHRRLRRLGRRAALVERQGRPARHLVLFDEPVAGGAAEAEASRGAVHLGGLVGLLPRALPPRRHPQRLLFELVSAPGHRRAARRRRPRRQERGHRRAGGGAAEPDRRRAEEESRRLRRRRAAPPPARRLPPGAAAEVRGHRDAAVLRRQLGRHGAASARQLRGLPARRLQAEMAGGARRHALHAVLRQVRPGPAAPVLRPFPQRHRQRLGEAAEGDAARSAIPARNSSPAPRTNGRWHGRSGPSFICTRIASSTPRRPRTRRR